MENKKEIVKIKEIISSSLKDEAIKRFETYLFGSRARGDFSPNSDYDILVVLKKHLGIKEKIRLFTKLRRILAKKRFNVDIVIKSADEVNYYKKKVGHIVRNALNEGFLI